MFEREKPGTFNFLIIFDQQAKTQTNLLNMKLIRAALGELSDLELAYFVTYTAINLATDTQQQIRLYLKERNLNKTKIRALIEMNETAKKFHGKTECCPRCQSEKLVHTSEGLSEDLVWLSYADIANNDQPALGTQLSKTSFECKVCSYPVSEENTPKPPFPGVRVFTSSLRS